jgi:hypothetical protein
VLLCGQRFSTVGAELERCLDTFATFWTEGDHAANRKERAGSSEPVPSELPPEFPSVTSSREGRIYHNLNTVRPLYARIYYTIWNKHNQKIFF